MMSRLKLKFETKLELTLIERHNPGYVLAIRNVPVAFAAAAVGTVRLLSPKIVLRLNKFTNSPNT